jgi:hypothetical protein
MHVLHVGPRLPDYVQLRTLLCGQSRIQGYLQTKICLQFCWNCEDRVSSSKIHKMYLANELNPKCSEEALGGGSN